MREIGGNCQIVLVLHRENSEEFVGVPHCGTRIALRFPDANIQNEQYGRRSRAARVNRVAIDK